MPDLDRTPDEQLFATVRNPRLRLLIPLVVAIAFLMEQLDSTIITTAIPDMARSFRVSPVDLGLSITAYVIASAVLLPSSGWLADRFGTRPVVFGAGHRRHRVAIDQQVIAEALADVCLVPPFFHCGTVAACIR